MISLIGQSDLKKFFCSSNDYIESMMTETPFCTITGMEYLRYNINIIVLCTNNSTIIQDSHTPMDYHRLLVGF